MKHLKYGLPQPCTIHEKQQPIGAKCMHTHYKYKILILDF